MYRYFRTGQRRKIKTLNEHKIILSYWVQRIKKPTRIIGRIQKTENTFHFTSKKAQQYKIVEPKSFLF